MKNVRGTGAKRPKMVGNVGYRLEGSNKFPDVDVALGLAELQEDFDGAELLLKNAGHDLESVFWDDDEEEDEKTLLDMMENFTIEGELNSFTGNKGTGITCYYFAKKMLKSFDMDRTNDEIEADFDFIQELLTQALIKINW